MPIFAGGALRASLDASKVRKNIQIAQYEKSIQTAFREVSDALAGRGTLQTQIVAQRQLVDASQRAYTLSQQRFEQGIDNYLSVLDAHANGSGARGAGIHPRRTPSSASSAPPTSALGLSWSMVGRAQLANRGRG